MKLTHMKWLTLCTGVSLLAGTVLVQAQVTPYTPPPPGSGQRTSRDLQPGQTKHFFRSKDLVGADVKDAQGKKVGDISELYVNPETGAVLTLVDIPGPRDAVMPLQALTISPSGGLLSHAKVTLKKSKADLESGPTVARNELYKLDTASFNQQVYAHYHLQPPSTAVGGAEPPRGGTVTGGESSDRDFIPHEVSPPR